MNDNRHNHENLRFVPFREIPPRMLVRQLSDPRVSRYLPLLTHPFDDESAKALIAAKSAAWDRDGLGHWGVYEGGRFLGWGGFERDGESWDFGLVLMPEAFGKGPRLVRMALDFVRKNPRIRWVTFLLDPERRSFQSMERLGAADIGSVSHGGRAFRKFRLDVGCDG